MLRTLQTCIRGLALDGRKRPEVICCSSGNRSTYTISYNAFCRCACGRRQREETMARTKTGLRTLWRDELYRPQHYLNQVSRGKSKYGATHCRLPHSFSRQAEDIRHSGRRREKGSCVGKATVFKTDECLCVNMLISVSSALADT